MILQHGNSTKVIKRVQRRVGAVHSTKVSLDAGGIFREKAMGCLFAYCKEDKETKKLLSGVELSECDQCTTSRVE